MRAYMNESLKPLDDETIPSQPTSGEVNNMFSMVVCGPKKGRMYGCGSMASTIYPDEMAPRPRGVLSSYSRGSQGTERMRAEWESQKRVNEHLRTDMQATQTTLEATQQEHASLKDRMTILEDQVRRLVAGLQPPRRFLYGRGSSIRGCGLAGSSHFDDPYAAGSSHRQRSGKVLRYSPEYIPPSQDFGQDDGDGDGDSDDAYDDDETQATGMNKSKDPFEIAFEEQEESPPDSPVGLDENEAQTSLGHVRGDVDANANVHTSQRSTSSAVTGGIGTAGPVGKPKEDDDDEEEENMDVELGKLQSSGDTDKVAKMQTLLAKFTDEQMSRYESFRRSGFQKSNMRRLLTRITGSAKISVPIIIVVSGLGKMFVGELIETARMVMSERKETGPIRPCHIREAYRRLKLEGKIPKRSVPRLFR